jgi:hypothetical protein
VLEIGEFEPAGQSEHVTLPVALLYFPVTHAVHVPPFGPLKPALQIQSVSADFAVYEFEFAGQDRQVIVLEYVAPVQSTHTALPVEPLYLPGAHAVQVPPFTPVKPALQVQSLIVVLPMISDQEFTTHATQVDAPALEYFPASHSAHV